MMLNSDNWTQASFVWGRDTKMQKKKQNMSHKNSQSGEEGIQQKYFVQSNFRNPLVKRLMDLILTKLLPLSWLKGLLLADFG